MKNNVARVCRLTTTAFFALAFCLSTANTGAFAQSKAPAYRTPKVGSSERKTIMDTLRGPTEKNLKMRVRFVVDEPRYFRVVGDWAFVQARFIHADGKPLGKAYFKDGTVSDNVQVLLHRVKGKWRVVTHVTGASDVEWEGWPEQYHAPAVVVPPLGQSA